MTRQNAICRAASDSLPNTNGIKVSVPNPSSVNAHPSSNEPVSIQSGNVSYEGEVAMLRSEYETLAAAGGGSVLDLQVDIVVSYGNPPDVMVTDKLMGCQFTEEENSMSQGDKNEEVTLPFIFLRKVKG